MRKILKYQLSDLKNTIIIFYLVYISLTISLIIFSTTLAGNMNGMEFSAMLVCFIIGLAMFREHYWMLAQNGVSRQSFFKGCLYTSAILSFAMALINEICTFFLEMAIQAKHTRFYKNLLEQIYPNMHGSGMSIINCLYVFAVFLISFILGLLISLLFYKANKFVRILIAAGIPITVFVLAPLSYSIITPFWTGLDSFLRLVLGITHGNPVYGIASLLLASVIISAICYPIVRKTQIA